MPPERFYQYAIIRPALIAVSQQTSDTPPNIASLDCSREESSRIRCSLQADENRSITTFRSARPIAGNLMYKNGFPSYSVAFVARRQIPLLAATMKPAKAMDTVGLVIAGRGTFRQHPKRRRSRTRIAPNSEATPRMWTRFTQPYVHTPDSRIAWPRAEASSQARNSYKRSTGYVICARDRR